MLIENAPKIGKWLKERPALAWAAGILLAAVLGTGTPWIITDTRPPAPCLMPAEQQKLDKAAKAAEVVTEIFGE
jgi:hypothetical protein